ncbi:hypothetical protein LCI18_010453 [Fusarium solani-melongenae]|uniref:Uncharacterized protein n=1 Tax=Fusarium solani subsp. cucurbitae TaxID=2747967 RepID=A0ACD3ZDZ3_FUSSC|nr:hypothetical protein LCI18_010453 [Fusarium solani-melongenae]
MGRGFRISLSVLQLSERVCFFGALLWTEYCQISHPQLTGCGSKDQLVPFILQRGVEAGPWTSVVAETVIHPRVPRVGSDQGRARREQVATLSITCFRRRWRCWSSTSCAGDQLAGEVDDQYRGSIARGVCWQGYREHGPLME